MSFLYKQEKEKGMDAFKCMFLSPGGYLEVVTCTVCISTRVCSGILYSRTETNRYPQLIAAAEKKFKEYKPDVVIFETNLTVESQAMRFNLTPIAPFYAYEFRCTRELKIGLDAGDEVGLLMNAMTRAVDKMLSTLKIELVEALALNHSLPDMAHKENFKNFLDPGYGPEDVKEVDTALIRKKFQALADELLSMIPDEPTVKDGYYFNAHLGNAFRELGHSKESFINGLCAYHVKRKRDPETKDEKNKMIKS